MGLAAYRWTSIALIIFVMHQMPPPPPPLSLSLVLLPSPSSFYEGLDRIDAGFVYMGRHRPDRDIFGGGYGAAAIAGSGPKGRAWRQAGCEHKTHRGCPPQGARWHGPEPRTVPLLLQVTQNQTPRTTGKTTLVTLHHTSGPALHL